MNKSQELATTTHAQSFLPDEVRILKETIMPGATDSELSLFGKVCAQTGLSPFARQIFPVSREVWNKEKKCVEKKWSFQTSVDGFRLVAQRSGEYEGQTAAQWCGEDGVWKDVWFSDKFPKAARVGVYRKNFREPLYAIAVWDSYVQTYEKNGKIEVGNMWRKMPELMIAKCAECLALRKAFPQELSGLYSQEEMAQSEEVSVAQESPGTRSPEKGTPKAASFPAQGVPAPINAGPVTVTTTSADLGRGMIKMPVTPKLSPDEFILNGKLAGKKIDEIGFGTLEDWAKNAAEHLFKSGANPETSTTDIARSYRAARKQLDTVQPAMFNNGATGIHGVENDVP